MDTGSDPAYQVAVADQQNVLAINPDRLVAAVTAVLRSERVTAAEVSVAVVDSDTMIRLNTEYLSHEYDTDVLSFLLEEHSAGKDRRLEGEVILSASVALAQAARFDWSPEDELLLYTVHGTLHLCGYDDQSAEDRDVMRTREQEVLQELGLTPHYADED